MLKLDANGRCKAECLRVIILLLLGRFGRMAESEKRQKSLIKNNVY